MRLSRPAIAMATVAALVLLVTPSTAATAVVGADPAPTADPTPRAAPQVDRIAGPARADTAAALARAVTDDPAVVYVVADDDFADGLAAGAAAAGGDGVVLLAGRDGVPPATADYLTTADRADLVVVGGTARLPAALGEALRRLTGRTPRRIAGTDRYATAADLALATGGDADNVWLVSGRTAPDALGAGAAAAATGGVLLSTRPDRLDPATRTALETLAPRTVTVVGGRAAVGPGVLEEVGALLPGATVRRVGAGDRYATSAAVAREAFDAPPTALVTTGRTWVDALAATPLAAAEGAPVVLVPRRCVTGEVGDVLDGVGRVILAGGEAAVSPRVAGLAACADEVAPVSAAELGPSWRPGCPVDPADLRRVTVDHRTLEGAGVGVGHLVVHRSVADDVVAVFDRIFAAGFGLHTVANVADYGADDDVAMAANATTAFNCRTVAGTDTWSQHAYGTAVDINPVQNPYVSGATVQPPAGGDFTDRTDVRPGMVVDGGPVDRAFADRGWSWGGRWRTVKDYQHFSRSGR